MIIKPGFETEMADFVVDEPEYGFNKKDDWDVGYGGSISAGVTLHNGKLFFGCADYHLYCVDARTGKEIWRFRAGDVNDTSYPVIDDGIVYSGFFDGYLYAVDESDGNLIWKFKTGKRVTGTPTVCDDLVIFGSWDEFIYAVDKKSGEEKWRFKTGDRVGCTPTYDGKNVYIGSFDGYVYALEAKTGRELWRFKTGGSMFNYHQQPIRDGIMYFTNWDGYLYALDTRTGREVWKFKMSKGTGVTPLVHGDRIYLGSWDKNFYCIDIYGKELWRFRAKDILENFKPLMHEGTIYFGSIDKNFYALNADTGKELWSFQTSGTIWSTAVFFEGEVMFGGWDCYLYALDWKTGKEKWRFATSTKNQALHILRVNYSFTGKIESLITEDFEEISRTEINVDKNDNIYSSKNHYVTKTAYSSSMKYGTNSAG